MKNNSTVPDSLRSSFEKSYEKVNDNLAWFDKYADGISKWALENREPDPEITITTDSTTTDTTTTTTVMSTTSPVTVNQTSTTTTSIGTAEVSTDSPMPVTKYITTTTYRPSTETTHKYINNCIFVLLMFCLLLSILTLLKVCNNYNML